MKDRRTPQGYKLRVYLDALRLVKTMTDEQWIQEWISGSPDTPWLPRMAWIAYLEHCVVEETERLFALEAA